MQQHVADRRNPDATSRSNADMAELKKPLPPSRRLRSHFGRFSARYPTRQSKRQATRGSVVKYYAKGRSGDAEQTSGKIASDRAEGGPHRWGIPDALEQYARLLTRQRLAWLRASNYECGLAAAREPSPWERSSSMLAWTVRRNWPASDLSKAPWESLLTPGVKKTAVSLDVKSCKGLVRFG